jgi:hypothetical protein
MLESLPIDHGRRTATRVGRCTDCRAEGVVTPTTRGWAGMSMCDMHIESREAIWNDCHVCYAEYYGGAIPRSPRMCGKCVRVFRETF